MATEEYSIGYEQGKQDGFNEAMAQQRTWVGLTIEEREQIQQECFGKVPHHVAFAHAIEAKLKEKNNA